MKTKDLVVIAIFITLSVVLANVRFFSSIAMDSVPAFVALFLWKDNKAALIAMIGHVATAYFTSFPFGIVTHIIIAVLMYAMLYLAAKIAKKNKTITVIFIVLFNAFIMPLAVFITVPFDMEMYLTLVTALTLAVALNMLVAVIVAKALSKYVEI